MEKINKDDQIETYEDLKFKLQESKQELMQADNKVGWLATILSLIITSLVAINIHFASLISYFLWFDLSTPVISLLLILFALTPKVPVRQKGSFNPKEDLYNFSKTKFSKKDFLYSDFMINNDKELQISSLIDSVKIYSNLARRKYIMIKISIIILFLPLSILLERIPVIINKLKNIYHKHRSF